MGGEFSKEYRRLDEVEKRLAEAKAMVESLHAAAASDAARAAAAGMPAAPGSNKARLDAAREYYQQLHDEEIAIYVCIGDRHVDNYTTPLPKRSRPFRPPPPPSPQPEAVATLALDSGCSVEPGTLLGGASSQRGWQAGSNSKENDAHAVSAEHSSEVVALLGAGTEKLAPGLRRRQGHGK